ncbi:MAG TPA: hypothetical protein VLZ06_02125 [Solirubrobacteraceae bacterium]|nr:hypothetical protein [Solirubrobacteraceae bacterium]
MARPAIDAEVDGSVWSSVCRRVRLRATLVCVGIAMLALLLLGPSAALALSQQGHVFRFSFPEAGAEREQLGSPAAIAVNESTGELYVAIPAKNRVEEFGPAVGEHGEPTAEKLIGQFSVLNPENVAVDNSTSSSDPSKGDVYVSGSTKKAIREEEPENRVVYKFKANGGAITHLSGFKEEQGEPAELFEPIEGLAVEADGELLVYDDEAEVAFFDNATINKGEFSVELEFLASASAHGLAVDTKGDLYTGHFSTNVGSAGPEGEPPVVGKCEAQTAERECDTLIEELDQHPTTAVAVDTANGSSEADDSYIVNVAPRGTGSSSTVAAFDPSGTLIQRFGAPGLELGSGVAVDSKTSTVYVTDAASDAVYVFERESPGPPRVDSLSSCATSCDTAGNARKLQAQIDPDGSDTHAYFEYGSSSCSSGGCTRSTEQDLGEGFGDVPLSEQLEGLAPGTYHYRVVASSASFGNVESEEQTFTIAATVAALPDGRAWEMVSPPDKDGFEPEPIVGQGGTIQAAKLGNAITYVADGPIPSEENPEGNRTPEETQVLSIRGATEWESHDMATPNTSGGGVREGTSQEYQAFSPNLSLALLQPFIGGAYTSPFAEPPLSPPQEFQVEGKTVKEARQEKTIYLRDDQPLAPEDATGEASYATARRNGEAMGNAGYMALVSEADALGVLGGPMPGEAKFGGGVQAGLELVTGTPDLGHVLFKSWRTGRGLYEWGAGSGLQLVSVLPKNEQGEELPATGTVVFGALPNVRHTVSNDGSLVFWTQRSGLEIHLYVRDTEKHETLQLDAVTSGPENSGTPHAEFQTASDDGRKVFFTDSQRLTEDSRASQSPLEKPDLYVFELERGPGKPLSGKLQDLTPEGVNGESAAVQAQEGGGGVLGTSEDGSYVYFVANAALTPDSPTGNCDVSAEVQLPERTCNLYQRHFNGTTWEEPRLVASISNEDAPDWGGSGFAGDLAEMTSRVSPDGSYLAFMSDRSLTGYDNVDASAAAGGALDEEVFLYDAEKQTLVCASCNPSGAQPTGVFDPGGLSVPGLETEGVGLVADRVGVWGALHGKVDHWLAGSVPGWTPISIERALYQSRYLSNSGRLFFDSPDALVPAVQEEAEKLSEAGKKSKEKVYEYEPSGVGSCDLEGGCVGLISGTHAGHEATFLDASENGDDVFFLTAAKLPATNGVSQDVDSNFDVYDARVCDQEGAGGSASCLPAPGQGQPSCEAESECKAPGPTAPSFVAPASEAVSSPGNPPSGGTLASKASSPPASKPKAKAPTRAHLLAKALKTCRSRYKAKSRHKQRVKCEAQARKRYAPASKKRAHAKKPASHAKKASSHAKKASQAPIEEPRG